MSPASAPPPRPLGHRTAALFVLLAWAALASPWLSGRVTIPWDAKAQAHPQFAFLAASLARGDSPAWAPNVFLGHPQIADPQSLVFSPPHLLAAWLGGPGLAADGFVLGDAIPLGMLALGALAILALFRDRGWRAEGGLVAALAFAFGGPAAWRLQHVGQVASLGWFAVTLWLVSRALDRAEARGGRAAAPWGLAAGLAGAGLLIGRDQVGFLGAWLLLAFVFARLAGGGRPLVRRAAPALGLGAGLGLVLLATPLVMTALFAEISNRPDVPPADAARGSLHPSLLLTLLVPQLFGTAAAFRDYWGPPSPLWGPSELVLARNMGNAYLGAVPLLSLAVLGVARGALAAREVRLFLALALLALAYALGGFTPVFGALSAVLPGAELFRRPADALFLACALLAILAGYGVHRLADGTLPPLSRTRALVSAALLLGGLGAAVGLAAAKGRLGFATVPLLAAPAWLLAGGAALWLASRARARLARGGSLVAGLVLAAAPALDLHVNNGPNESTALPPERFASLRPSGGDPLVALLRERLAATAAPDRRDRVELSGLNFHAPNAPLAQSAREPALEGLLGYNPLRLGAVSRLLGAEDHAATLDQRRFPPSFPSYAAPLAALAGLRFVAWPADAIPPAAHGLTPVGEARTDGGLARVFETARALPRARVATRVVGADAQTLLGGGGPDADPALVVLEPDAARALAPRLAGAEGAPATARIELYRNTEVVVAVDAPAGGVLVLADAFHPWWRAEVDGAPAPILRAHGLLRAVPLPPGARGVRFAFHPVGGAWGEAYARARARMGF